MDNGTVRTKYAQTMAFTSTNNLKDVKSSYSALNCTNRVKKGKVSSLVPMAIAAPKVPAMPIKRKTRSITETPLFEPTGTRTLEALPSSNRAFFVIFWIVVIDLLKTEKHDINPELATMVKNFSHPADQKKIKFKEMQKAARKDVERAFGMPSLSIKLDYDDYFLWRTTIIYALETFNFESFVLTPASRSETIIVTHAEGTTTTEPDGDCVIHFKNI
ncbi:hypothetical protein LXL04_021062 [Taraxacum kok-saghyz]